MPSKANMMRMPSLYSGRAVLSALTVQLSNFIRSSSDVAPSNWLRFALPVKDRIERVWRTPGTT